MKKNLIEFHLGIYTCLLIGFISLGIILHAVSSAFWQMALIAIFVIILIKACSLQNSLDTHDLTGLLSRRKLNRQLRKIYDNEKEKSKSALLFIDIDQFKDINDAIGHIQADFILRLVAEKISDNVFGKDLVANYGGDEFVVALLDAPQEEIIKRAADRIRKAVEDSVNCKNLLDLPVKVTVSIGAVCLRNNSINTAVDAIECAERAMKHAKLKNGRNCTVLFNSKGEYINL